MPYLRHRSLVKPLEVSSWAAARLAPNALIPAAARSSTMPSPIGPSGPTTTRSTLCDRQNAITAAWSAGIERDQFGVAGDAGIAGRAVEPLDQRARGDLPGQRVLAAAGADKKDVHWLKLHAVEGGGGVSSTGDARNRRRAAAVPMIGAGTHP